MKTRKQQTNEETMANKTKAHKYLETFFAEKNLKPVTWELTSSDGTWNLMPSSFVIEQIMDAPESEKIGISNVLRKLDFLNADINDYLKHLAGALIG